MQKLLFVFIIFTAVFLGIYYFYFQKFYLQNNDVLEPKFSEFIRSGGPPKDGIPAIDSPHYTTVAEADTWLLPNDVVFGVAQDNLIAAYPQRILVWHEIVNEKINNNPIIISYCPLTGTAIGYNGGPFGVSGKLLNSNLIMYDRLTDSYWPQILGEAISGPSNGSTLSSFPVIWTTWEKWKKAFPSTKVLSQDTGYIRDYSPESDPYGSYVMENGSYYTSDEVIFTPLHEDKRLSPKTVIVGIRDGQGNALAIEKGYLRKNKKVESFFGDQKVFVNYNSTLDSFASNFPGFEAMWFAWAGFYPNTELIR